MAITENDLIISNKSYTNKDFESIYTELLDLATKISYKFNPTDSNESDVFIILMKLLAFVGDKVNYNVDKNVLERFITSATQRTSVANLCDTLGYHMHYYNASTTDVIFTYNGTMSEDITIPQFSIVQNNTGDVQFVTSSSVNISSSTKTSSTVTVYQGELKQLTILDSTKIQLENLDDNNRLYFSETRVAENGVFIFPNSINWTLVDNLNVATYGSTVYSFGYDSVRGLPYLEFPEWVNEIIGDGLTIYYIVTSGEDGNVVAKAINTVASIYGSDSLDANIKVSNSSAALTGKDPETINEAYNGFKKTIGTFETLVSCRDFANFIYNKLSSIVSNVQVSDRRTDINYSRNVLTYSASGVNVISMPDSTLINGNDLCVYPTKPINDLSFSSRTESGGFIESFTPALYNVGSNKYTISSDLSNAIENGDDDNHKCISHNYMKFNSSDIFAVKNYYRLTAIISTTTKVNSVDQVGIIENVNNALASNFNSRKVDFGEEIPYDTLLSVIENADSRIKSVSLYEPSLTTKIVECDSSENELTSTSTTSTDQFKSIVAQNILNGRIALYSYNDMFKMNFLNSNNTITKDAAYVTTKTNIGSISTTHYTLLTNEVIQFIAPELVTKVTYPYGVNYYLSLSTGDSISANSEYTLTGNDLLIFSYTTTDGIKVLIKYTSTGYKKFEDGTLTFTSDDARVITPNTDLATTLTHGGTRTSTITDPETVTTYDVYTLTTKQEVYAKEYNVESINKPVYYYWHLQNVSNEIKWDNNSYLLKDDEYFFYMNSDYTNLMVYGAGTTITKTNNTPIVSSMTKVDDVTAIIEDGIESFKSYFKYANLTTYGITLTANEFLTLTTGDSIWLDSGTLSIPDNSWSTDEVSVIVKYRLSDSSSDSSLPTRSTKKWKVRALLDINCGPEVPQTLSGNQTINFFNASSTSSAILSLVSGQSFELSETTQKNGGELVDISYIDITKLGTTEDTTSYPSIYSYTKTDSSSANYSLTEISDGINSIVPTSSSINLNIPNVTGLSSMIMIYYTSNDTPVTLSANSIIDEKTGASAANVELSSSGMYIFTIDGTSLTIATSDGSTTIPSFIISNVRLVKGINPELGLLSGDLVDSQGNDKFQRYLRSNFEAAFNKFYSLATTDAIRQIETSESLDADNVPLYLNNPRMFYDVNNMANKWTLSEIDFANSRITIAKSSTK